MSIGFLAPARAELEKAVDYHNDQSSGLGFEFAAEVNERWNALSDTRMPGALFRNALADAGQIDSPTA